MSIHNRLICVLRYAASLCGVVGAFELSLLLADPGNYVPGTSFGASLLFLAFVFWPTTRSYWALWDAPCASRRQAYALLAPGLLSAALLCVGATVGGAWACFVGDGSATAHDSVVAAWVVGGFVAFVIGGAVGMLFTAPETAPTTIRGTDLTSHAEAMRHAAILRAASPNDGTFWWGGLALPQSADEGNFLVVGAMGSGKTTMLRHMMQTLLPQVGRTPDWRALIYDPKGDMLALLSGMDLPAELHILNPFDARSSAWDMARDVTDPGTALQVASILIPAEDTQNPFFPNAARAILAGVMKALMSNAGTRWTLADVVRVAHDSDLLRRLLESVPDTRPLIDQYFAPEVTFKNVHSTIATRLSVLEPIAALWESALRKISLNDWIDGGSILVLGCHDRLREALDAINRVLFQRLTELALDRSESQSRRTWCFLDEVRDAGKLEGLRRLMTKGRSKGARVVLGLQDIEGLRKVYGDREANELAGVAAYKSFLRLDGPETARWAADAIGQQLRFEYTSSHTSSPGGPSRSTNEHIAERAAVLASQLMHPARGAGEGLIAGYHIAPRVGVYHAALPLFDGLRAPGRTPNFMPRPVAEQYLKPFDDEALERLGLRTRLRLRTADRGQLPRSPLDDD